MFVWSQELHAVSVPLALVRFYANVSADGDQRVPPSTGGLSAVRAVKSIADLVWRCFSPSLRQQRRRFGYNRALF
ncbi:hypothetical protein L596_018854 [Steinernema carpocapsae]|uniref:Uncharacterized protein n=1 Tax=Steinernema carpocapsae TaxID=34508 RepID=A0A4U5N6L4_STECR|nr:hypothetical protein L596_018854 [Steinernema carpocapsae]